MITPDNIENLLKLENTFKGKRCFIVATGPSLSYRDLSFLKNEVIIGVNLISLFLDQQDIRPNFLVISDGSVAPNFENVLSKLIKDTDIKKVIISEGCQNYPEELIDKNTYFIPKRHPKRVTNFSTNPIKEGFWRGQTAVFDALQLAYFLGFEKVYILGMDFDLNCTWGIDSHSYLVQRHPSFPGLVFPKITDPTIQRAWAANPKEYLGMIDNSMKKAREVFEKSGRKIINDTRSSLSIFDKEDILKKFGYVPKVVAFLPAKGTSTRVPGKNVRMLGDKPLFLHLLDTLLSCKTISEVYLDSESNEIFELAKGRKHKELHREIELASNQTDGNKLFLQAALKVPDADIYIEAFGTSPFLSKDTIDRAVFDLIIHEENDSSFVANKHKLFLLDKSFQPSNYNLAKMPNSFDLPDTIIESTSLYMIRKEVLFERKLRIGKTPRIIQVSKIESIDIDYEDDFRLAEAVYYGLKNIIKNEQ